MLGAFIVTAALAVRSARTRLALVRVTGASMVPTFADGDRLLVRRAARPRCGDVVVFRNPIAPPAGEPDPPWLVKRVVAVPGDRIPDEVRSAVRVAGEAVVPPGRFVVRGDAERSQDSRHFGYVHSGAVLGIVLRAL